MEDDSEFLEEGFYIENSKKNGWFLLDFGHKGKILHLIWSTNIEMCQFWKNKTEVEKLLEYSSNLCKRAHIVDLTTESGYHGFYKRK